MMKDLEAKYSGNLIVLKYTALKALHVKLRDAKTPPVQFKHYADRLMRILAEEGLAHCNNMKETVQVLTPTGVTYSGPEINQNVCAVSIVRAGDSLLNAVMQCEPAVSVGKILIQRDESTEAKIPKMFYSKLPPNISQQKVLLVDPMLATGGSAKMAIKTLLNANVKEEDIIFLNVVACPEGINALFEEYPNIHVVTAGIDPELNEQKYIVPGLGDYGDRYFNTLSE